MEAKGVIEMELRKLSPVINIDSCESIDNVIEIVYSEFKLNIMNKEVRARLFNKFVFIKFEDWVEYKAGMFWHLISLNENEKFNVFPCGNTASQNKCNKNCISQYMQITLNNGQKRSICIYRAIRINWINDIIVLANKKDERVKVWIKDDKLHLRFQYEDIDYVVILAVNSRNYQLISAFPVFYINKKEVFDTDYNNYTK